MSILNFTPANKTFYLLVSGCIAGAVLPLDLVVTFGAIAAFGLGEEIINNKLVGGKRDALVAIWAVVTLIGWHVGLEKLVSI